MRALSASGVVGLILVLSGCASQYRQETAAIPPETRIRIWHNNGCCAKPIVGRLVAYDADSLRVRAEGSNTLLALPWISISSIERPHRASHPVAGLGLGILVGGIAGVLTGRATSCSHCDGDWRDLGGLVGGVEGALLGAMAGAGIGAVVGHEEWESVPLEIPLARSTSTGPGYVRSENSHRS